ncbi:MAG: elongation factor G [Planctomycetota bacterium]
MGRPAPSSIRNVCIVGHSDAGKTSLADALLFKAGAVTRQGNVKDKSSVFDHDDQEHEKQHSLESALAHCEWDGLRFNIIDTPGYPDFIGDAVGAISASDGVIICVNASQGVQVNTRRVFDVAEKLRKARIIVLTKGDMPDLDFEKSVAEVQTWFGKRCVPIALPNSFGPGFSETEKFLRNKGGTSDLAKAWYQSFVEGAVEFDDDVTMKYIEGEEIGTEDLKRCFCGAVGTGMVTPIISTSVEKDVGLRDVLDSIKVFVPDADVAAGRRGLYPDLKAAGERVQVSDLGNDEFYGQVFKVVIDKHVGKVAFLKVHNGVVKHGDIIHNSRGGRKEKVGHLVEPMGKELEATASAVVGDTVALTKIDSIDLGDTISSATDPMSFAPIPFPRPMAQLAVRPATRGDETKISEAFSKLSNEIPTFEVDRDPITNELIAHAMSNLQLEMAFQRLKDRYGIEVTTSPARIPYRETVQVTAEGHYRHKKQSGGRGQFGEVFLKIMPCEPGSGLQLDWDIVGGSIPSNFAPAIEKGIREKMAGGVIAGYPILDAHVSVHDGKFHDVDSSEAAFKIAGGRAFAEAIKAARPILLEPILDVEIVIPGAAMGDVSGDLNTRRGRIQGMDAKGQFQIIKAHVPKAEMGEYPRVLTSLTSGEGSFSYEECGYEAVPGNVQQQIIADYKPHEEEE